jgi:hypothetical protein
MGAGFPRVAAPLLLLLLLLCLHLATGVRDQKYYKTLGIDPSSDEGAINKAYRKLAM